MTRTSRPSADSNATRCANSCLPAALPSWLAAGLAPVESTRKLTTVFPERSRWREAAPLIEPNELGELGRASLLVQQTTWQLTSYEAADAFRIATGRGCGSSRRADAARLERTQHLRGRLLGML